MSKVIRKDSINIKGKAGKDLRANDELSKEPRSETALLEEVLRLIKAM